MHSFIVVRNNNGRFICGLQFLYYSITMLYIRHFNLFLLRPLVSDFFHRRMLRLNENLDIRLALMYIAK